MCTSGNAQTYKFGDYIQFGRNELTKGNFKEAIRYLNNAVSHRPASYEGYFLRGIAKYYLDDFIGAEEDFTEATKYDPYNSDIYHYRAIVRSRKYNFGGALDDYTTAIKLNPKNPLFYLNKARAFLFLQDYDSALINLDKTLELKYRKEEVFVLRGMAWSGKEEYDKALADLNKAIKINPDHLNGYIQRGAVKMELHQPDSAILDFNQAIEKDPGDSYALFNRALARMDISDTAGALNDLNAVIEISPYNSYAYYNRAILKIGEGDDNGAVEDLDRVVALNPDNIAVYLYRGRIKRSMGKLKEAIADFDKAIEIYPEFADAYYERSQAKKQMQDYKGAEQDYKFAYKINEFNFMRSDSIKLDEEMYLRRLLAFSGEFKDKKKDKSTPDEIVSDVSLQPVFTAVLFAKNIDDVKLYDTYSKKHYTSELITVTNNPSVINSAKASAELDRPDSGKPSDDVYFLRKAGLYADIQDYSSSLEYFNKAVQFNPDLVMAYFGRANMRFKLIELLNSEVDDQYLFDQKSTSQHFNPYEKTQSTHNYEEVLEDYSKVIELDPKFPYAWYNRGFVKVLMGDYWGAVSDFTKASELDPEFAEAFYNKGLVLIFQQVKTIGCKELSVAGELGVDEAYEVIKRFCVK